MESKEGSYGNGQTECFYQMLRNRQVEKPSHIVQVPSYKSNETWRFNIQHWKWNLYIINYYNQYVISFSKAPKWIPHYFQSSDHKDAALLWLLFRLPWYFMTLKFKGVLIKIFWLLRWCPWIDICLISFSWLDLSNVFLRGGHRGKVPFWTHHIKVMHYQYDLSLLMLVLIS